MARSYIDINPGNLESQALKREPDLYPSVYHKLTKSLQGRHLRVGGPPDRDWQLVVYQES